MLVDTKTPRIYTLLESEMSNRFVVRKMSLHPSYVLVSAVKGLWSVRPGSSTLYLSECSEVLVVSKTLLIHPVFK